MTVPLQRLQGLLLPRLATLRCCLDRLQQSLQIFTEGRECEAGEIWRCHFQFDQRILEMLESAVANAPADLMVRGGGLNQALYKKTPSFRVALPDLLPGVVRFPILAGVEQRNTVGEIGAILLTQLRRELRGVRGRRPQAVPAR